MTDVDRAPDWTTTPMPQRIAKLPRNKAKFPVPWFVGDGDDGQPDFRVIRPGGIEDAIRFNKCWMCGDQLGKYHAFNLGPMCCVNRVSPEPPSHRECAVFAAQVCPFLTTPNMVRRENRMPDGTSLPAGNMIRRNPGVALIWVTNGRGKPWKRQPAASTWIDGPVTRTGWSVFYPDGPGRPGLIEVGDPVEALWFAHGRPATRAEVDESIRTGLPILRAEAEEHPRKAAALADLDRRWVQAQQWLPAA